MEPKQKYRLKEAGDSRIIGSDVKAAKKNRTAKKRKPAAIL